MWEISFQGKKSEREQLEKELYKGELVTDDELKKKAGELEVNIHVTDFKKKVSDRDDILVEEVSLFEEGIVKKRRLYDSAGNYAIAELRNSEININLARKEATS